VLDHNCCYYDRRRLISLERDGEYEKKKKQDEIIPPVDRNGGGISRRRSGAGYPALVPPK
jgi:hypothetical protein